VRVRLGRPKGAHKCGLITAVGDWADRPDWHPTDELIVFSTYGYVSFQGTDEASNLFTIRPNGTD